MSTYPENRDRGPHRLQWFALSIAGGFFLSFFVYWVSAALLALSLGAVATAFDRARRGERVSRWLALPATAVFAFVAGSFFHGFSFQPNVDFRGRVVMGATEVFLMTSTGGDLPPEGATRIAPWRHVALSWVALTGLVLLLDRARERRRSRRA